MAGSLNTKHNNCDDMSAANFTYKPDAVVGEGERALVLKVDVEESGVGLYIAPDRAPAPDPFRERARRCEGQVMRRTSSALSTSSATAPNTQSPCCTGRGRAPSCMEHVS